LAREFIEDLGSHRIKVHASQADEIEELHRLVSGATLNDVRSLARNVASNAESLALASRFAYRHANGFKKITLFQTDACRLRLHIWDPTVPRAENTHSHRWPFASRILVGAASETRFDLVDQRVNANEYGYSRPPGSLSGELLRIRSVSLIQDSDLVHEESEVYSMSTTQIHRVNDFENSSHLITLVLTGSSRETRSMVYSSLSSSPRADPVNPGMTIDETAAALHSFGETIG